MPIIGSILIEALGGGYNADGALRTQEERIAAGLTIAQRIKIDDAVRAAVSIMTREQASDVLGQFLAANECDVTGQQPNTAAEGPESEPIVIDGI